ncbi:MAG: electron transfer flavoprotein subunit beta/FixA family protein [Ardenticatenaceae bacterium]|nr:electron transfer flavoprotein subunit beta/FixA family protein [Ardenticatenaceae bacterium]
MKVVVCVKQTPSTTATISVNDNVVTWEDTGSGKPNVVNPWDEYTIEEGIRLKENHGATETIALTFGSADSVDVLRTGLAMGCTSAVHISNEGAEEVDALDTAAVLAAAIEKVEDVKVAMCGKQAIDGDSGVMPMLVARKLGWTPLTFVAAINEITEDSITVERLLENGRQVITAKLPVVMSVVKEINEPRYPSFMGIRKANRATVPTWSLDDLGVSVSAPRVNWQKIYSLPAREGSVEMIDGDSMNDKAKKLVDKLFEEKVI